MLTKHYSGVPIGINSKTLIIGTNIVLYTFVMSAEQPIQLTEEDLRYSDIKITYVEHLSVINYLTKAMEDTLISKANILKYPLLLIDIPLLLAVAIINIERSLYNNVIEYFLAYVRHDVRLITKFLERLLPGYQSPIIEEEGEEDIYEETIMGKLFQLVRNMLHFLWSLIIFSIILPVWPLIKLYNFFSPILIIGTLYYILMFFTFTGWWESMVYFIIFCTVTFLVSSLSVPTILRTFIYLKYLFSLEPKSWQEVNNEARLAFVQFYLRIQHNRQKLLEKIQPHYTDMENIQVKGGVYYLFLKTIHGIKDKLLALRKKRVSDLFTKLQKKSEILTQELEMEKKEYEQSVSSMKPQELIKTAIALMITFFFSGIIALGGSKGQGVLVSIFLSFLDPVQGTTVWWNYEGSGMGYYQYLTHNHALPGVIRMIVTEIDYFWGYFFLAYHTILPFYASFLAQYYAYWVRFLTTLFY
jgi:hypothetical protein